ncbi:MAG: DbpA RNA binding domain-containing protein [Treponema sp.]|nr:DbpA RNA binding domain-containing protein [Treponema sp.]
MYHNNYRRNEFKVNKDQTAAFLANAVDRVNSDSDVESLVELAKEFKKNVPLTRRKYVTALLLREALKHDRNFLRNEKPSRKPENEGRKERAEKLERNNRSERTERAEKKIEAVENTEEKTPHIRVEIPEGEATTIFISVGRNRRVFPRDLVSLLINVAGLDRERIGNIKVLANYSFVQLYTEDSEKAISALNEYEYRGRKLMVNLSKQKDASAEATEETAESQTAEISDDEAMSAEDAAAYAAAEKASSNEGFGN